ncbi:ATP-binding protein [Conchiformibius kuhniae]|uniref:Chemotaxis protein CheA n=1 Tax=Conchiformibius kuhniae TaxID=211502 RepID=A0A8T9MWN0_9NEIS|nr:ATP-binding protein [Conchiformibius kuhniae]
MNIPLPKPPFANAGGRYTLPAVSVLVLTVLLASVLVFSYSYADKLNRFTAQIDAANKFGDALHQISVSAHYLAANKRISDMQIDDLLATAHGTDELAATLDGDSSKIRLDAHAREHLQPLLAFWQKYRSLLPAAGQTQTHNQNQLRQLNEYAHSVQIQRDEALQKLRTALLRDSRRAASVSRMLHLLGALIIAAGLVLSVLHFVKQWKVDRKLEAARLETDEILDTLSEGLFLLDKDMIIGTQQSKMLGTLLPQIGEGGQNFMDLAAEILPDRRKLSSVKMFIEQLYNPRVVERLIYGLNPLRKVEVPLKRGSDERHVLGFHFTRVIKDRQIVKVLVSVRDLTDTVRIESRLQREQEQNDLQIEMISRMLNADEVIMRSFLHTSLKQLAQINTILKNPGNHAEDLRNKARLISQEIHAFKGEASVLNMSAFVLAAEAFEDIIQQLRQKRPLTGNDFLPLVVELESLLEKVAQAEELHRKITGRLNNPAALPTAATATDLGTLFGRFVVNMGYRHNKSVIMETGGLEYLKQESPTFPAVKDIIIQVLRNAVVHGIEPVRVRTLNGKPSEGRIRLNVTRVENKLRILIEDDGRGIDWNAVRAKAVQMQMATLEEATAWPESKLYGLLFRSGFSTLPESNQDAGRGIGMDIVRARIQTLNGRIAITTEAGKFTCFVITFPIPK